MKSNTPSPQTRHLSIEQALDNAFKFGAQSRDAEIQELVEALGECEECLWNASDSYRESKFEIKIKSLLSKYEQKP